MHGSGNQKRSFLYVRDFCEGIYTIIKKGKISEIYNIGSNFEYKNIDVAKMIAKENKINLKEYIYHSKDRPFNDFRYSINFNKIKKLGWKPKTKLENKISEINNWYRKNFKRYKSR